MPEKKAIPKGKSMRLFFLLLFSAVILCANLQAAPDDFFIPKTMTVLEERIPLENRAVYEMLEREIIISACDRAQVLMWIKRSGRYFPHIEQALQKRSMPDDLKYLAVAESALITHSLSTAGARGPWQFMKHTARQSGLRKNRLTDERLNFEQSTEAALNYLSRLHRRFNSWTLAAAAYNCGANRLYQSIQEQKVTDYFRLNLPLETERYIYRIAAVKLILEHPEKYGFHVSPERVYRPIPCDTVTVTIKTPLRISDITGNMAMDYKTLKELNPQFTGDYLPAGKHRLKAPPGSGRELRQTITAQAKSVLNRFKKYPGNMYTVQYGDTLGHISERTGVPVRTLRRLNGIKGSLILAGQKLRLSP